MHTKNQLLAKCICEYIIPNQEINKIFEIRIGDNYLKIKYKNHFYFVKIIEENDKNYWYLKPYGNAEFITNYNGTSSFERILLAIKENEKFHQK